MPTFRLRDQVLQLRAGRRPLRLCSASRLRGSRHWAGWQPATAQYNQHSRCRVE